MQIHSWCNYGRRSGFTLVEVLISIALVLIIILGVNQVFSMTSRVVAGGQALSEINRNARAARAQFIEDAAHAETERAPYFGLRSLITPAFRDRADMLSDRDFNPAATTATIIAADAAIRSLDRDEDGIESTAAASPDNTPRAIMTRRTHRTDQIFMFTRSRVRRQTGDAGSFISDLTSNEALVVYGHLKQPNDVQLNNLAVAASTGATPSAADREGQELSINNRAFNGVNITPFAENSNNFFATQWVLGRNVLLLRDPNVNGEILDASTGRPIRFIGKGASSWQGEAPSGAATMAPFAVSSRAMDKDESGGLANERIDFSIYDIAGSSMSRFRDAHMTRITGNGPDHRDNWWSTIIYRFTGYPIPSRPLTSGGVARTVPCFVPNCTQFAVEFAGDFLYQNPANGELMDFAGDGGRTDGEIDFAVVNGVRQIRWYGYPRDTNRDGKIDTANQMNPAQIADTIPLWDTVVNFTGTPSTNNSATQVRARGFPFERDMPPTGTLVRVPGGAGIRDYATAALPARAEYWCVWGPDTASWPRPQMLRITMAVDDPQNRIGQEQFFEYIVKLP